MITKLLKLGGNLEKIQEMELRKKVKRKSIQESKIWYENFKNIDPDNDEDLVKEVLGMIDYVLGIEKSERLNCGFKILM